nr:YegP family protein [Candidatus Brachybacter algidus]
MESVKKNSADESEFDIKTSTNGKFDFNLKSSNGQIIAVEMAESEAPDENGIASVMKMHLMRLLKKIMASHIPEFFGLISPSK